jgi:hypothetical protein
VVTDSFSSGGGAGGVEGVRETATGAFADATTGDAAPSFDWVARVNASWSGGWVSFEQLRPTGARQTDAARPKNPWYKDEFIRALNYFGASLEVKG